MVPLGIFYFAHYLIYQTELLSGLTWTPRLSFQFEMGLEPPWYLAQLLLSGVHRAGRAPLPPVGYRHGHQPRAGLRLAQPADHGPLPGGCRRSGALFHGISNQLLLFLADRTGSDPL